MEAFHWFGNDLSVNAAGDLLLVSDLVEGEQRVLRRLLTNPGGYIWHLGYGAGLGRYVGQPTDVRAISAVIRAQMAREAAVQQSPPPRISVVGRTDGVVIADIQYTDSITVDTAILRFPLLA